MGKTVPNTTIQVSDGKTSISNTPPDFEKLLAKHSDKFNFEKVLEKHSDKGLGAKVPVKEKYSISDLKNMFRKDLDDIAIKFGLNPKDYKNKTLIAEAIFDVQQ